MIIIASKHGHDVIHYNNCYSISKQLNCRINYCILYLLICQFSDSRPVMASVVVQTLLRCRSVDTTVWRHLHAVAVATAHHHTDTCKQTSKDMTSEWLTSQDTLVKICSKWEILTYEHMTWRVCRSCTAPQYLLRHTWHSLHEAMKDSIAVRQLCFLITFRTCAFRRPKAVDKTSVAKKY